MTMHLHLRENIYQTIFHVQKINGTINNHKLKTRELTSGEGSGPGKGTAERKKIHEENLPLTAVQR